MKVKRGELRITKEFLIERSTPEPNTGCWLWTGCLIAEGYACQRLNGKNVRGHRLSYEQFIGAIPGGMLVLHSCDQPACINPAHLFLGTHKDNAADKVKKRRCFCQVHPDKIPQGEDTPAAKLTNEQALYIYKNHTAGTQHRGTKYSTATLAKRFGVSRAAIRQIVSGRAWSTVTGLPKKPKHLNK